jgi:hypothetical protein
MPDAHQMRHPFTPAERLSTSKLIMVGRYNSRVTGTAADS